jgi:hypothetical protein
MCGCAEGDRKFDEHMSNITVTYTVIDSDND